MNKKIKDNYVRRGFTLIEILAVLVVISILIGLLVPVLANVKEMAAILRQKAQFAAIEIGLEAFNNDFGDYPNSERFGGGVQCCGAQKLAEAMVGLDGYGFHKESTFRYDGYDSADIVTRKLLYDIYPDDRMTDAELKESIADRKGPYLELETANAVSLRSLYPGGSASSILLTYESFVLADKFGLMNNAATGKKTGKPILYLRANTNKQELQDVYDYNNNLTLVGLAGTDVDSYDAYFYPEITHPNFTVSARPYRAESFILISAGHDGIYGTADEVFNFDVEK